MRPRPVRCAVALGANLGDAAATVRAALAALDGIDRTRLVAASSLYRTRPVGPPGQPDYVNAAALVDTRLDPEGLLAALQALERAHGRRRDGPRWGPRTLDLDLLTYGPLRYRSRRLEVPHPRLAERAFVLVPLAEIAPHLVVLGLGTVAALRRACGAEGILERIGGGGP